MIHRLYSIFKCLRTAEEIEVGGFLKYVSTYLGWKELHASCSVVLVSRIFVGRELMASFKDFCRLQELEATSNRMCIYRMRLFRSRSEVEEFYLVKIRIVNYYTEKNWIIYRQKNFLTLLCPIDVKIWIYSNSM